MAKVTVKSQMNGYKGLGVAKKHKITKSFARKGKGRRPPKKSPDEGGIVRDRKKPDPKGTVARSRVKKMLKKKAKQDKKTLANAKRAMVTD